MRRALSWFSATAGARPIYPLFTLSYYLHLKLKLLHFDFEAAEGSGQGLHGISQHFPTRDRAGASRSTSSPTSPRAPRRAYFTPRSESLQARKSRTSSAVPRSPPRASASLARAVASLSPSHHHRREPRPASPSAPRAPIFSARRAALPPQPITVHSSCRCACSGPLCAS